jgi:hypothetical protein
MSNAMGVIVANGTSHLTSNQQITELIIILITLLIIILLIRRYDKKITIETK